MIGNVWEKDMSNIKLIMKTLKFFIIFFGFFLKKYCENDWKIYIVSNFWIFFNKSENF